MSFTDLGLSEAVLKAVADTGYTDPTPIQAKAIPFVLQGRDVLGCAQTGTGKTASFTLPMIEILSAGRARARMPRSLILAPTRELAAQVQASFERYGKYTKLNTALLVGGESMTDQKKLLQRGVHALIATPGRMLDQFERGNILLTDIKMLVLDECDRMLDMGFIPDIEKIVSFLPQVRQTLMFSATLPPEIRRLADAFLSNPKEVSVAPPASPAETVEQSLVVLYPPDKRKVLRKLLKEEGVKNAMIFCNRKRDVRALYSSLKKHDFRAGEMHGDMSQPERTETLRKFKADEINLMVCSDVAARGLDIQGLSHVFNFDVPFNADDYVHRIGRTGRAGSQGRAISLAVPEDGKNVADIEKLIGKEIPRLEVEGFDTADFEDAEESGGRRGRGRRSGSSKAKSEQKSGTPKKSTSKSTSKPTSSRSRRKKSDDAEDALPDTGTFGDDIPSFLQQPGRR